MNEKNQKIDTLYISVHDSIFVSEEMIVEILIIKIATNGYPSFSAKEIAKLREVLRISIRNHADELTEEKLSEFGTSMLCATAVVLKAKYLRKKHHLKSNKK